MGVKNRQKSLFHLHHLAAYVTCTEATRNKQATASSNKQQMGGNAIKTVPISRIDSVQKLQQLIGLVQERLPHARFPAELPEKKSFGDLDVIVPLDIYPDVWGIICGFSGDNAHVVRNGPIWSFAFQMDNLYHQIDFVTCKSSDQLSMYNFYFSYGYTSYILGMMCRKQGLSLGQDGLSLVIDSALLSKIDPTFSCEQHVDHKRRPFLTQPEEICQFLGLDYNAHATSSFASNQQVFDWILSCRFSHNLSLQKLEAQKESQKQRPFQIEFMEYFRARGCRDGTEEPKASEIGEVGEVGEVGEAEKVGEVSEAEKVVREFNMQEELQGIIESIRLSQERKRKFSGKLIKEAMKEREGRDGGEGDQFIGQLITMFKKSIESDKTLPYKDFNAYLDAHTAEEVRSEVFEFVTSPLLRLLWIRYGWASKGEA